MNKMLNSLVLLTVTTAFTSIAHASLPLAQKGGCMACHGVDKKIVGPAYKDVADKYKGQKDAVAKLMEKVRKGGSGAWGTMAMPATGPDKLNDADLKAVIEWVLKGAT